MFERFTKPARSVVTGAERYADQTTASEIRPEHLLMALLDQEGCVAVQVMDGLGAPAGTVRAALARFRHKYVDGLDEDDAEALRAIGIDLDEVLRRIDRNLGGLSRPRRHEGKQRFSRPARKVLELALREATSLHHGQIGTEHLLLGLARSGDRVVTDALAACQLDRAALRQAVADAVRTVG